jgi:hypothetical protein
MGSKQDAELVHSLPLIEIFMACLLLSKNDFPGKIMVIVF